MVLAAILRLRMRPLQIVPYPTPGPQSAKETFGRRKQLFELAVRLRAVVSAIENGDLKAHLRAIPALRSIHDPMHRRFGMLAGFQKIQRLKEHTTEAAQLPDQLAQLRVFA